MAQPKKSKLEERSADPRVAATSQISGTTIAALAICIPLVAILKSPIVAFVVIGGAALAIASVWLTGRSKTESLKSEEITKLEATIKDLQERLENVEVINRYETALAERAIETELAESELVEGSPREMGPKGGSDSGDS